MCAGFPPCIFAFYSRPLCSKTLPQTGAACFVFTVFSVGPTPPPPTTPTPSQPAGGDAALLQITQIRTRFICSASDLIGHRALKKSLLFFFLLCMFPHSSSRATSDVRVCPCVYSHPEGSPCTFIPNDLVYGHNTTTTNSQTESHFEGASRLRSQRGERDSGYKLRHIL